MMVTRNRNRSFSRILVVAIALMLAVGLFCGTGAAATNMDWTSYTGATNGDITITDASGSTLSHKTTLTISQDAVLDFGDAKTYALTGSTSSANGCGGLVDKLVFSDASKVLTIKNLHITSSGVINSSSDGIGGLFGRIESNGKLILENCSINGVTIIGSSSSGGNYVAGLVGYASSASLSLSGCMVEECTVLSSGSGGVGGLVGCVSSPSVNLSGCVVNGSEIKAGSGGVGGLVGSADSACVVNMSGCVVNGSEIKAGSINVGGLIGYAAFASVNMSGCMVDRVYVSGSFNVGGLVGNAASASVNMSGCVVNGSEIKAGSGDVGGLVGDASSASMNLSGCKVSFSNVTSGSSYVGGLVGNADFASMNLRGCKVSFSNVTSGSAEVGGLVGHALLSVNMNMSGCMVDRVYVSGSCHVGGLVGYAYYAGVNMSECMVNGSEVTGSSGDVGGLVGYAYDHSMMDMSGCIVEECKVWSSGVEVGGLVGYAYSTSVSLSGCMVEECTVLSSCSGDVAGLVGRASDASIGFIGDGCWVNDSWVSGTSSIGSFVGSSSSTLSPLVAPQHSAVYSASTTTGSSAIANNDFDGIGTKEQYGSPIDRYGLVAGKDYGYISYKSGVVASGTCGVNLTWVLSDDGTLTISGTGAMYDYSESSRAPWYQYRSQMTKLVLPNGLRTIGMSAFSDCSGFTGNLIIPDSVTRIGWSAFKGCSGFTGSLTIPNSVTTIGMSAFSDCSGFTGNLIIPDSVTTIGWSAFNNCSGFTGSLIIPNSVTTIGMSAFNNCSGFTGSLIIPNNVTTIEMSAFNNCSGFTGSLTIPNNVTTIEMSAFSGCSGFTGNLIIPDSVTTIGWSAFEGCSGFTGSLTIPNNVTTIGMSAFSGCSGFTGSLTIPNSVTTIGMWAFDGCFGITNITIPSSVTSIGYNAFKVLHANSVIYAECPAGLVSGTYSTDRTALAVKGTNNAYTFTVDSTYFLSGFSLTSENAPVKENSTFAGWYATPSYLGSAVSTVTDGQTLYAKWSGGADGFHLYAGWNVVSTPKKLSSAYDMAAELFAGVNTTGHAVLTYNAQTKAWEQVTASTKIEPLNAYWIYSNESKILPYEFSSTVSSPASKSVYKGWNAVSLSADEPMSAAETFGNTNWYTYLEWNAASQAFKSPLIKGGFGTHADTNLVSLWTGGWLFLNEDGTYMGFTA